jgi:hypothetical protein
VPLGGRWGLLAPSGRLLERFRWLAGHLEVSERADTIAPGSRDVRHRRGLPATSRVTLREG